MAVQRCRLSGSLYLTTKPSNPLRLLELFWLLHFLRLLLGTVIYSSEKAWWACFKTFTADVCCLNDNILLIHPVSETLCGSSDTMMLCPRLFDSVLAESKPAQLRLFHVDQCYMYGQMIVKAGWLRDAAWRVREVSVYSKGVRTRLALHTWPGADITVRKTEDIWHWYSE